MLTWPLKHLSSCACMYILYNRRLRSATHETFYGAVIFVGTYFKNNISIILLLNFNTVNNVLIQIPKFLN